MNGITRQILSTVFFAFLIIRKLTGILSWLIITWLIIKLCCWNAGAASTFFFCIFIFCIRYRAYQRKIEAQK
nr:MAG TPA: hypothetical protein [Caudoviricetes sp.]